MPQNNKYNYGNDISEIEERDKFYLQLNNNTENPDPRIDSNKKYLFSFTDLKDNITSGNYETLDINNLNFNVSVDDDMKSLSYQDKRNILKRILKNATPSLDFDSIELNPTPIGLNKCDNKLYLILYENVTLNKPIIKPSTEVLKLFYIIACFSHFAQMYFRNEIYNENKELNEKINFILFKDTYQSEASVLTEYYKNMFNLFDAENINIFKELVFIPKRYEFKTISKWYDGYTTYNATAECNATNRVAFYKMYKYNMKFFYPTDPIKEFSSTDCGFTKLSDFLKGLDEIKKEELTFEIINDPLVIERYNLFIENLEDNNEGIHIEKNKLSELDLKNKYLKYKAKYLNLKNKYLK